MGYFSQVEEAELYEAEYCVRCVHYCGSLHCIVMTIHMSGIYNEPAVLDVLIPLVDGNNCKCAMFCLRENPNQLKLFKEEASYE